MSNPYETLGVPKDATADAIRKAYRKLAKANHPDLNPGKADAERRFKEITAAYDLLSDPAKRARFDRGEIDGHGNERSQHGFSGYGPRGTYGAGGFRRGAGGHGQTFAPEDLDDVLSNLFGQRGFGGFHSQTGTRMKGGNLSLTLTVDFVEAVKGGKRRVTLPDGRTLDVDLPQGLEDGATVRLKGLGLPGVGGGPPGDALVKVTVRPHPFFRRQDDDVLLDLPVTLHEAVLGAKVRAPTIDGAVMLTVPRGANNGSVLRLKGKGVPGPGGARGDQYVTLRVALPDAADPELESFLRRWSPPDYDPRAGMDAG